MGLRLRDLGTSEFQWGDLKVVVSQAPRSSAMYRSLFPEEAEWGLQEQLLAAILDDIAVGNWQRSGGKKKDYPKQTPRPGVTDGKEQYGSKPLDMEDMAVWLGGDFIKD